jgi:glycosyltransferase involved in cell wall biosynthesis
MKKKIAVLIPCYNEVQTVGKVVKDYKKALPEAEIFVYDNNSTDSTDKAARKAGATVRYEKRQGKGNVVRSQFREIDADVYLLVDGDDTYPAEHARDMVDLVLSGQADMVIGDRLSSTYFTENKRFGHNFGNVLVRFLINKLFKAKVHDIMTGQRAFSYQFVKTFPVLAKGFEIETEMTIHALDKNLKLVELPVDYRDRPAGSVSKLDTIGDGFLVMKTIFNLVREYKPLFFFGWAGLISLAISIAIIVPTLIDFANTDILRFPTFLVGIIFIIITLLLWITGLILDLIAKKHRQLFEINLNLLRNR